MERENPEPIGDPLAVPVGRLAHTLMTMLEPVLAGHGVVLVLVDPSGEGSIAIESGGFDHPTGAIDAVSFAARYMRDYAPTDVSNVPRIEV